MKKLFCAIAAITLYFTGCAAQKPLPEQEPVYSSLTLDGAIADLAAYFTENLPEGSTIAIVSFEGETGNLSDYVLTELWNHFENSRKFVIVDRKNLDRIRAELNYQMSGEVSDESVRAVGQQYGPQIIVYGQMTPLGKEYRMILYGTDVEKASSLQRAVTIGPDSRLASLLNATLEEKIAQAAASLAHSVDQKTTIALGRISYSDTETVSSLSAYLKNSFITAAQKQQNKFIVASEGESADFALATRGLTVEEAPEDSPIQAVVVGNFSPLGNDAKVSLQLISTGKNKVVLGSTEFIIPGAELTQRKLSLLPEKDNGIISKTEFEAKQKAVAVYEGKNNKITLTVTPDVLDGVYYEGDAMSMRIYSSKEGYFRIIHVDVQGIAQVLYPRVKKDNNFIRAGETRRIPDNSRFRMGPPFGEEYILVALYDKPFALKADPEELFSDAVSSRGIYVEAEDTETPMSPLGTAKFSYTILPK